MVFIGVVFVVFRYRRTVDEANQKHFVWQSELTTYLDGRKGGLTVPTPVLSSRIINRRSPMIQVENLVFNYPGDVPAVRDLSVCVREGERVALIGPNGSGKSTFARCLNGLLQPAAGRVEIDGHSTTDAASIFDIRRRLSLVFQNPDDQLVSTTVESEIAFGLENLGTAHTLMVEAVESTITNFSLERYRHHPPHLLSGGEKQRLAIAACVALQPRYLVLDEPTALLDPAGRQDVMLLLQRLHDQGVTLIHITQDPAEAARADRIIVMNDGDVFMDASPADVFSNSEQLRRIGLGAPYAAALTTCLRNRGVPVEPGHIETVTLESSLANLCHQGQDDVLQVGDVMAPESTPPEQPPKLSVRDVSFTYEIAPGKSLRALSGINLDIPPASAVAIIGPSGSGKTTLAQHFNGLLRPDRGQICLDGDDIWLEADQSTVRSRVGLVFQFPEMQLFAETLAEDVAFGPRNSNFDEAEIDLRVRQALDVVGLPVDVYGARSPFSLSAGQRRRAAIAGVLAMQPQVLVLDEPTAGLDPHAAQSTMDILNHLLASGRTLVLISHDMDLVATLASHVVVMQSGNIALSGSAREVLADPDFEKLSGLEAPPSVALMRGLRQRGCQVPTDLIRRDEVVAYFAALGDEQEKN